MPLLLDDFEDYVDLFNSGVQMLVLPYLEGWQDVFITILMILLVHVVVLLSAEPLFFYSRYKFKKKKTESIVIFSVPKQNYDLAHCCCYIGGCS